MLVTLAIILFVLWMLGVVVFKVAGAVIHLLLIIAVVVVLLRVIQGRKPLG